MKQNHQFRVAGVGTAIGAVMLGGLLFAACAPGKLPCEKDEWKEVCALPDDRPSGQGGSGGGGGGGGSGGSGGDVMAAGLNDNTAIECADFPTLKKMDDWFGMRCGVNTSCHATGAPWSDLKKEKVWERLSTAGGLEEKAKVSCAGGKLIDTETWSNSVIYAKSKMPVVCPSGGTPGLQMPPAALPPMMAPLSAGEIACLESFLKVIAAGK